MATEHARVGADHSRVRRGVSASDRLAGASRSLAAQAAALGRGETVPEAAIPVREFDDIGRELVAASAQRSELERQLVQPATQDSERRFQILVEGVSDYALFMLDPDGKVTNWNSGATRVSRLRGGRDRRPAFLPILYAGGPRRRCSGARAFDRDQRGQVRSGGLEGPQGRQPVLGQRRHRPHRGFQRRTDRLGQNHPRYHRAARGAAAPRSGAGAALSIAKNGCGRAAHRRRGARLQQSSDHHYRQSG